MLRANPHGLAVFGLIAWRHGEDDCGRVLSVMTIQARYGHPWRFFFLATVIPWALWVPAAWLSHQGSGNGLIVTLLGIGGLLAPVGVTLWMARRDPVLLRDMVRRIDPRQARAPWMLVAAAMMPVAILVATVISLAFGYSPDQFLLRGGVTFTAGLLPGWVVLVMAPVVEELAWHSYGTDALRTRFSIVGASLVFIPIWALWHVPLAFIAGSSQAETVEQGWLHTLNFPLSMIPFVLLMNWVYYRSGRNITVTIVFHLAANLITQVLATHPDTEVMATGVLLLTTGMVLWFERELLFARAIRPTDTGPPLTASLTNTVPSAVSSN